ncbi:MAG: histidine phosphatase family protein [Flammeovirgaceae bacterium]|nr:histidine phosphatase family protein [Flammeovirgaceae bacterium]
MISKKIYLIRHGQTDFNVQGIVQGSGVDTSLNDTGRKQSQLFFDSFKNVPFKKVYTSALKRSIESVSNFISGDIPYEKLPELNEISWGVKEGRPITPEEDTYYHSVLDEWRKGNTDLCIKGGESPEDVLKRQKPAIKKIIDDQSDPILICMHGRAMRILLCQLLNYPLYSMDLFEHNNLCLYVLNHTGSMFTIEKFNDTGHLIERNRQI